MLINAYATSITTGKELTASVYSAQTSRRIITDPDKGLTAKTDLKLGTMQTHKPEKDLSIVSLVTLRKNSNADLIPVDFEKTAKAENQS